MSKLPRISDAEWEVMKIIWRLEEVTSSEVIDNLKDKQNWKNTTIKSLISRLLNKEAIGFKKLGKEYFYFPLVSEEECIKEEMKSFLNKVFNGSLNNMLLSFIKSNNLTKEEIKELKDALNMRYALEEK
ncbi:BlaI/MecI/CopY family transcriptional regulator [Clostridium sp. MB05]|uniref:BlaI/MecI/CopY family transcriptional regulator n=1 Tax=Clostridium sp. MB05 TaxID=3376682 RepID=UPI003982C8D7